MTQVSRPRFVKRIEAPFQKEFSRLLVLMVLIAGAIGVLGYVTFEQYKKNIDLSAQKNLASIANLKANQIIQWRKERFDEANGLTENTKLVTIFEDWLRAGAPANADRQWMLTRLGVMQRTQNYTKMGLLDPQGAIRLSTNGETEVDAYLKNLALEAMRTRKVMMSPMHLGSEKNRKST